MTRIVAGQWGGRRLQTPKGDGTRPTSDRVREAMFSSLESELGGLDGLRVLDLFAGSGALGLEALSRGAEHADLVESDRRAASVIALNIRDLDAAGAELHRTTAERFVGDLPAQPYDLVLLDPPYSLATDEIGFLLTEIVRIGGLDPDGIVVVERSTRTPFSWPGALSGVRDKAYGET
ncbi:16S rRNA (guanine(966)-N(2))-methyltransferase RsmD, partial [Aeromicrobium sp.]|uniref:16S rRNA (guanine(966)-N(2))-methyltransferase RsmD n=1 Tax=Aeromicrobium sp. TaxID=1871063 RepID=UPI003D6C291B